MAAFTIISIKQDAIQQDGSQIEHNIGCDGGFHFDWTNRVYIEEGKVAFADHLETAYVGPCNSRGIHIPNLGSFEHP